MKTKKILRVTIAFILIAVLLTGSVSAAIYTAGADDLKSLKLFMGSEAGYELDREVTNAEAAVLFVRLLGKEAEAKKLKLEHPFTDVPAWASPYVGYLYNYLLEKNIIDEADEIDGEFYPDDLCGAEDFCMLVLLALGYAEDVFDYDDFMDLAEELGLIDETIANYIGEFGFNRDACVAIIYNALSIKIKDKEVTLINRLANIKAIDRKAADKFINKNVLAAEFSELLTSSFFTDILDMGQKNYSMEYEMSFNMGAMFAALQDLDLGLDLNDLGDLDIKDLDLGADDFEFEFDMAGLFEALMSDMKMKMNLTVFGDDCAIDMTTNYSGADSAVSVYFKDGYLYMNYMGEKIKMQIPEDADYDISELFSISEILSGFKDIDIGDGNFTGSTINNIEKVVTMRYDTYTIKVADESTETEIVMSFAFNHKGEFVSIACKVKALGSDISFKITVGADVKKIRFPDFSDYIEADEEIVLPDLSGIFNMF